MTIKTTSIWAQGKSHKKRNLALIGGGTGLGAAIGAIAAGGTGAAIGAISGAGAGTAGAYFDSGTRSLFGWGFFLVPIAFAMLGVAFIKSIHRQIAASALLGTLLFVLAVLGVFYSVGSEGDLTQRILQGGYLGVALGWPLFTFLGFWATMVILVGLVVVAILLALDVPIYQLFMRSSEEEDKAKEAEMKEKDIEKLVVRSGGKPLEDRPIPAMSPPKMEEKKEFVIRALKAGSWRLPPTDFLSQQRACAA